MNGNNSNNGNGGSPPHVVQMIDELLDGAERLIADMLYHRSNRFRYSVVCLVRDGTLAKEIRDLGVPVTVLGRRGAVDPTWSCGSPSGCARTASTSSTPTCSPPTAMAAWPLVWQASRRFLDRSQHNVCEGKVKRPSTGGCRAISTRVVACSEEVGRVMREQDHRPASRLQRDLERYQRRPLRRARGDGVREEFNVPAGSLLDRRHRAPARAEGTP